MKVFFCHHSNEMVFQGDSNGPLSLWNDSANHPIIISKTNLIIVIVIFIIKHWKHLCSCLSVVCITLALKSMDTHFVCLACAYVSVRVLKAVYLFPLRTTCLRYWVSLPALQMLPLTFLDCSLLIMGARFPPGCRCSYGLVSSSYWLPAKPKAGGTLIKDT